ncbi:MAG: hypothetical protein ABIJ96_06385 [Elusimicrobiota bacterium]
MRRAPLLIFPVLLAGCFSSPTRTTIPESVPIGDYKRIAVMPFQSQNNGGPAMADAFATGFMSSGFMVVERGLLEGILKTQKIDFNTDALKPEDLQLLGQSAKVDAVIFGTINSVLGSESGEIHSVSLRMVDVKTGDLVMSSTYRNSAYLEPPEIPEQMMKHIRKKYRRAIKVLKKKAKKKNRRR